MKSDQFKQAFIEESMELLSSLESRLLEMEESPDDAEKISAVFRIIHTIKGSSAMFGFNEISEFTHHVENILDGVRNRTIKVSRGLVDWTLKSGDHITALIEADEFEEAKAALHRQSGEIVAAFQEAVGLRTAAETAAPETRQASAGETSESKVWRIRFKPRITSYNVCYTKLLRYSGT